METKVPHFIFSSTAAVYGMPEVNPVTETARLEPISPYGGSKLMTETMLRDTAIAYPLRYVALRYFNVAGADPLGRSGQSTRRAGDPAALVAGAGRIREVLGWEPRRGDLDTIVGDAFSWEKRLTEVRAAS